tara:strand:+ start:854 stop:1033 length:180 start_codon:yes stop_codon:yes gene_type:complete
MSEKMTKGYRTMPWSSGRVSPHKSEDWLDYYQGKDFTKVLKPNIFKRVVTWYRNNYWIK